MRRQRRRVRRRNDRDAGPQQRGQRLRVPPPQNRDQRPTSRRECLDRGLGDRLPALAPVARRASGLHRQAPVQQQHTLLEPATQIAVKGGGEPQIVVQFAVDVHQALRQRSHVCIHRETQADRMPGRRVGILTDQQHPHIGHRPRERPQHFVAGGQIAASGRHLGPQELAHLVDPLLLAGQCVGPIGCQQLADLTCAHCTAPSSSGSLVRTLAVHALTRIIKTAPTPKATGSG